MRQKDLKESKANNANMYKLTLDQQAALKDEGKNNYGKMTFQEKRINRQDLDHYKKYEHANNALVPGINHLYSIGSRPMKVGALNQFYTQARNLGDEKGKIFAQPITHYSYSSLPGLGDTIMPGDMQKVTSQTNLMSRNDFEKLKTTQTPRQGGQPDTLRHNPILMPVNKGFDNKPIHREVTTYQQSKYNKYY